MKCKKLVVKNVSSVLKEDVKSFKLPEIVVDHCTNIPEQDSTESVSSVRSSVHNSLDDCQDPACHFSPSGSSSRSESPTLSDKNSVISASLQVIGNNDKLKLLPWMTSSKIVACLPSSNLLSGLYVMWYSMKTTLHLIIHSCSDLQQDENFF